MTGRPNFFIVESDINKEYFPPPYYGRPGGTSKFITSNFKNSNFRSKKFEVGRKKSEVRSKKLEVRSRKLEERSRK